MTARSDSNPLLSVIVPAHQAASLLPETLGALAASHLPRNEWQLIVVDDASSDATTQVAQRYADRVITLTGAPRGPGAARNAGCEIALGEWLVFIDADVRVHGDTLSRFVETVQRNPQIVAVFGAYDADPSASGLVSQYRNLLHRYVHLRGAGEAETFWSGCGAVRKSAFVAVGGFDITRFPPPQVEDIELGYRLRDAGGRILLDPTIQGTHLKKWTFRSMLRTDFLERGVPWMRLLLERRRVGRGSLNTSGWEKAKVAMAGAAPVLIVSGLIFGQRLATLAGVACLLLLLTLNLPTHKFFSQVRGVSFAIATVPLHLTHYCLNAASVLVGAAQHFGPDILSARRRSLEPQ